MAAAVVILDLSRRRRQPSSAYRRQPSSATAPTRATVPSAASAATATGASRPRSPSTSAGRRCRRAWTAPVASLRTASKRLRLPQLSLTLQTSYSPHHLNHKQPLAALFSNNPLPISTLSPTPYCLHLFILPRACTRSSRFFQHPPSIDPYRSSQYLTVLPHSTTTSPPRRGEAGDQERSELPN